jgi:tRNA uridine 5-carbamoylmethylation protein Kti12
MKPTDALLIITGSMGSGKTTVLYEASDILTLRNIPHASIDLDALGTVHLPSSVDANHLMYRNLRSVWGNYAQLGLRRLLLARAIENRAELDCCRDAVSGGKVVICRLTASMKTMQDRLQCREIGTLQDRFVARVAALDAILDRAHLEDFSLLNENRPVTDVAHEMLVRAAWL